MVGPAPSRGADTRVAALDGAWPAIEVSPDGTIVAANEAFARCLGRSAKALSAAPFIDLVHAEDRARAAALSTATAPVELRLVDAAGGERVLLIAPLEAASRILLCCDLTEQRQAERAARKAEAAPAKMPAATPKSSTAPPIGCGRWMRRCATPTSPPIWKN